MEPWKVHTDKAGSLKFRLANGWLSRVPGLADGTKRAEVGVFRGGHVFGPEATKVCHL